MSSRCRICTTNDHEGLVEELSERIWENRRDRDIDPDMSPDAPPYWQMVMRGLASETIELLRRAALRAEEGKQTEPEIRLALKRVS